MYIHQSCCSIGKGPSLLPSTRGAVWALHWHPGAISMTSRTSWLCCGSPKGRWKLSKHIRTRQTGLPTTKKNILSWLGIRKCDVLDGPWITVLSFSFLKIVVAVESAESGLVLTCTAAPLVSCSLFIFLFFVAFIHSLLKALAVRIRPVGGSQHDNKQEGEKKGKLFEGLLFFGMKRTTQRRRRRRRTSCVRPVSQDLGENRPGAATQTLGIFAAFVILFYSRRDAIPSLGLIYS